MKTKAFILCLVLCVTGLHASKWDQAADFLYKHSDKMAIGCGVTCGVSLGTNIVLKLITKRLRNLQRRAKGNQKQKLKTWVNALAWLNRGVAVVTVGSGICAVVFGVKAYSADSNTKKKSDGTVVRERLGIEEDENEKYSFEKTGYRRFNKGVFEFKYGCTSQSSPFVISIDHAVNEKDRVYGFNISRGKKDAWDSRSVCFCKIADAKVFRAERDYENFVHNGLKANVIDALKSHNHVPDNVWFSVIKKSYEEYCGTISGTIYYENITGEDYARIFLDRSATF